MAGSKVVVSPNFVNDSNQFQYELHSNGDGKADLTGCNPGWRPCWIRPCWITHFMSK